MISDPLFYKLLLVTLVWLCIRVHVLWPSQHATTRLTPAKPPTPPRRRPKEPKPFAGLIRKPHCDAGNRTQLLVPKRPRFPHPRSSPHAGGPDRVIPPTSSAPMPPVPTTAGSDWAISAPMGIPAVVPGASCIAANAQAIFLRRRPLSSVASACYRNSSSG
jgi:hypothetical protein